MEMKIITPIAQLPKQIEWNYEEILVEAERSVEKYKGLIYEDTQIAEAKEDRAKINAQIKTFKAIKHQVKKEINEPYEKFAQQIDNIIAVLDTAVIGIDTQVKGAEKAKKDEKKAKIVVIFENVFSSLKDYISIDKIWNDRWLNVTYNIKTIEEEIKGLYESISTNIKAIYELKSEYETELLAIFFDSLSISKTLIKHNTLLEEKEKAKKFTSEQVFIKTSTPTTKTQEDKVIRPTQPIETIFEEPKEYSLRFEITATKKQLEILKDCLVKNNIKYVKI